MDSKIDVHLMMVMNYGSTLQQWNDIGIYNREMALYRLLAKKLRKVSIVTWSKGEDLRFEADLYPINIICNDKQYKARIWQFLFWLRFRKYAERNLILKTNQMPGSFWVAALAKRAHALLIARCGYLWSLNSAREFGVSSKTAKLAQNTERRVFKQADHIIITTEAIKDKIIEDYDLDDNKVQIIPNYVDLEKFHPARKASDPSGELLTILAVGRLSPEKNHRLLFEAVAKCGGYRITVAGQGPLREELQELAISLSIDVTFLGVVEHDELPDLMRNSDVYAITSEYEGNPKSLLEAMACGCPVIGTKVDGISNLISHSELGLLVEKNVTSVARGLDLYKDSNKRLKLGALATKNASNTYSLDAYVEKIICVVKKLI